MHTDAQGLRRFIFLDSVWLRVAVPLSSCLTCWSSWCCDEVLQESSASHLFLVGVVCFGSVISLMLFRLLSMWPAVGNRRVGIAHRVARDVDFSRVTVIITEFCGLFIVFSGRRAVLDGVDNPFGS